jgi:hypothetical protein
MEIDSFFFEDEILLSSDFLVLNDTCVEHNSMKCENDADNIISFLNTFESQKAFAAYYINTIERDNYYSLLTALMKPTSLSINMTQSNELLIRKIKTYRFLSISVEHTACILRCLGKLYTSKAAYTHDKTTLNFRDFLLNKESLTPKSEALIRNLSTLPRNIELNESLRSILNSNNYCSKDMPYLLAPNTIASQRP